MHALSGYACTYIHTHTRWTYFAVNMHEEFLDSWPIRRTDSTAISDDNRLCYSLQERTRRPRFPAR